MNSGATFACEALAVWPRARILGIYSGDPAGLQNLIDELSSIMKGKK